MGTPDTLTVLLWAAMFVVLSIVIIYYKLPQEVAWEDLPPKSNLVYDWEELTIKDTGIRVILPEDKFARTEAMRIIKESHNVEVHTQL